MPVVELFVRNGQQLEPLPPVCVHSGSSNVVYHGVPVVFPGGTVSFHLPLSPKFRDRGPITDTTATPSTPEHPAGVPYSFRIPDASDAFVQALFQLRSRTAPAPSGSAFAPVTPGMVAAVPQGVPGQPMAYPAPVPASAPVPGAPMPPYYAAGPAYPPGYAPPPPGFPVPPTYPAPVGAYPPANGYPSPIAPGEESEESSSEGFDDSRTSARRTRKREPAGIPSWVFAVVGGVFLLILIAVGVLVMGGKESSTKPTEPSRYQPVPKSKEKDKEKTKGGKTKPTEPD